MNRVPSQETNDAVRKAASDWIARRDAGLSEAEEAAFQAWRKADPRHAEAVARYESLWQHLDQPRARGAGPQLRRDLSQLRQDRQRRRRRRVGGAAGLVMLALVGWWGARFMASDPSRAGETIVVQVPERQMLSDGSVVEYPVGTIITVDLNSPDVRRVLLASGEAHFQVAKDPARPFVVGAAGLDVAAVGTAFSVRIDETAVNVVVTEGRVAVEESAQSAALSPARETDPPRSPRLLVDAGHGLSVNLGPDREPSALPVQALSTSEVEQRLAWRNPRMEFSNARLSDVVATINRYVAEQGGVQFTLQDPSIGALRMSGVFRIDDAQAIVGILERGFGIETEQRGEREIVLQKRR